MDSTNALGFGLGIERLNDAPSRLRMLDPGLKDCIFTDALSAQVGRLTTSTVTSPTRSVWQDGSTQAH